MSWLRLVALILVAAAAPAAPAHAVVHSQMYCWVSDVEFPIDCEEEEEDDDDEARARPSPQRLARSRTCISSATFWR